MFDLFAILVVGGFFVCAIIGFVQVIIWIAKALYSKPNPAPPLPATSSNRDQGRPILSDDIEAGRRLAKFLHSQAQIDTADYRRILEFLDRQAKSSQAVNFPKLTPSAPKQTAPAVGQPEVSAETSVEAIVSPTANKITRPKPPVVIPQVQPETISAPVPVERESRDPKVAEPVPTQPTQTVPSALASTTPETQVKQPTLKQPAQPAPWDLPDPPPKPPRRTFGEILSGFMEEKNMRWGELTSGILIVMSAVGLVVSLRDQLTDRIPYFSSLLFLLITAAIHGAGIYTLKQWRLRNTSRGTLLIGLMLIPINFLAACLLNGDPADRFPTSSATFWIAVCVGLIAFGCLAFWSSKLLFRRGHIPLVLGLIGSGASTLFLNRTVTPESTVYETLLFAMPLALSFLLATVTITSGQWRAKSYTGRSATRLQTFLGIAVFAAANAIALVMVRAESAVDGAVAMLPLVTLGGMILSWVGMSTQRRVVKADPDRGSRSMPTVTSGNNLIGVSLLVLGIIATVVSVVSAISHPGLFTITAAIAGALLAVLLTARRQLEWTPWAGVLLIASGLSVFCQFTGRLPSDAWVTVSELLEAILTAPVALYLLASSLVLGAVGWFVKQTVQRKQSSASNLFLINLSITSLGVLIIGCAISLTASILHRDQTFEVLIANVLLVIAAGVVSTASLWFAKGTQPHAKFLVSHLAALLIGAMFSHLLIWDPRVASQLQQFIGDSPEGWLRMIPYLVVAACWGLTVSTLARLAVCDPPSQSKSPRPSSMEDQSQPEVEPTVAEAASVSEATAVTATECYLFWAVLLLAIVSAGPLVLIGDARGWATALQAAGSVGWFVAGLALLTTQVKLSGTLGGSRRSATSSFEMIPFLGSTLLAVGSAISELGLRRGWISDLLDAPHLMLILGAAAIWSIAYSLARMTCHRIQWKNWLTSAQPIEAVVNTVALASIGLLLLDQTFRGVSHEIFGDWDWAQQATKGSLANGFAQLAAAWPWIILLLVGAAVSASSLLKPQRFKVAKLIALWFIAWSYLAVSFNGTASAATAIRWLVPIGGLCLAGLMTQRRHLVPLISRLRSSWSLPGKSAWSKPRSQPLINLLLAMSATAVLTVSTLTTGQVLLNSPDSLGGPLSESIFKRISLEVNFGLPIVIVVATFLLLAISEQRRWLATAGSFVFQIVVLTSLYFLIASPHEKIASRWFIGILQSVSIGMTAYGLGWYAFRDRIQGIPVAADRLPGTMSHLQLHTLINGALITGMAAVVLAKVYFDPTGSIGWINSFGSWLGILAWMLFLVLAGLVWRKELSQEATRNELSVWSCLVGWTGLMLVALIVAFVDGRFDSQPVNWATHKIVALGLPLIAIVQIALGGAQAWIPGFRLSIGAGGKHEERSRFDAVGSVLAIALVASLGLLFSIQGSIASPDWFWAYQSTLAVWSLVSLAMGLAIPTSLLGFLAWVIAGIGLTILCQRDPHAWFSTRQPDMINLIACSGALMALLWSVSDVAFRRRLEAAANWFPNIAMPVIVTWLALATVVQFFFDQSGATGSMVSNPIGWSTLGLTSLLVAFHSIRNPNARPRVASISVLSLVIVLLPVSTLMRAYNGWEGSWLIVSAAAVVLAWGLAWVNRNRLKPTFQHWGWQHLKGLEHSAAIQLPIYSSIVGLGLLASALWGLFELEERPLRYAFAAIPLMLAINAGTLGAGRASVLLFQRATLALLTIGAVCLAWAELSPEEMTAGMKLLVRTLIVLGGAMFVYGALVSRWVRTGDSWLRVLRESAAVTCCLAVVVLVGVILIEAIKYQPDVGCGISIAEALGVAVVILGMVLGLITIAIRPQNDPFSLSVTGRMAYVYTAQLVATALVAHLYFSAPWLFEFGLRKYWPFILMAICFAGVGIGELLRKRQLQVLAVPLFNSATVLPVLVAVLSFVDSRGEVVYDPAAVMLTIGLMYLMVCYLRKSVVSGAACVIFGNAALWLLLHKYPSMAFLEHPQLWLIPPAISALVGSTLIRDQLSQTQLTSIRYLASATIYISSTSEIFIRGIGDSLWPPMLLMGLSVAGILVGMLMRIKSFLYLGSLFLLMAMLTMVSHAHQRFDHIWPWWAFGIGLGIAILVMFGLFEKRKNDLKRIAAEFRQWSN